MLCALSLDHVEETMRPLPSEPLAGVPAFIRGLAIIRGVPTPVIDAALLVSGGLSNPTRFVTVKTGNRRVALAVDSVIGTASIPHDALEALPPLFAGAGLDAIAAVSTLNAELLLVLSSTRLVPDDVWRRLAFDGVSA